MKKGLLVFLIFLSFKSYSQITFDKGYIILNDGEKKVCLIKNYNWANNPKKIEYKINENDAVKYATVKNILGFGFENGAKYIRANVDIDKSSNNLNYIDYDRKPKFKNETLFLKILVEGNASLYKYKEGNLVRFFYKIDNNPIKQLIYKLYLVKDANAKENEYYKQQLLNNLRCKDITLKKIEKLSYKKDDLIDIFVNYNKCVNGDYIYSEKKAKRHVFNLNLRLGLNTLLVNSTTVNTGTFDYANFDYIYKKVEVEKGIGVRIGVELEYILPYNKNKWGILFELTRQSINYDIVDATYCNNNKCHYQYDSFEGTVGMRYYLFLNKDSKFYINTTYDVSYLTSVLFFSKEGWSFEAGYNYKKFIMSLKLRAPLGDDLNKTFAFMLGYKVL